MKPQKKANNLIALEGAAFAGKTTFINYLRQNYPSNISVIPEGGEFIGGDENGPSLPFNTYHEACSSTHFCLAVEKERCNLAQRLEQTGRTIIMDRCTPISSLVFYKLVQEKAPELAPLEEDFYQHALELFSAAIKQGEIDIPSRIIYIRPSNEKTFRERLSRGAHNTIFEKWSSFQFLDQLYRKIFTSSLYRNRYLELDSENTVKNLQENAEKVIAFANNNGLSDNTIQLDQNFLGEYRPFKLNIDMNKEKIEFREFYMLAQEAIQMAGHNCIDNYLI